MARRNSIAGRLYRGEVSFDFVSRQKIWYSISGGILAVSVLALLIFGLNFSIDFKGGTQFTFVAPQATATQIQTTVKNAGGGAAASAQEVKPIGKESFWQVQTESLTPKQWTNVQSTLAKDYNVPKGDSGVAVSSVSSSWGSQISEKALEALIAFLIVIVLYLSIAFEWRMAAAALVALLHDIVITVGVYALAHFEVSPATVIGLLTILGYSLYDTVVVFDKVRENTAPILGTRKSTYSQAANLALNQTLVRSINTSLIALLPVTAILIIGTLQTGNGELKDLALVLFVGMLSGTYSSICIATPVLADLKERDPQYKQLAKQVAQRAAGGRAAVRRAKQAAVAGATAGNGNGSPASGGASAVSLPDSDLEAGDDSAEVPADDAGADDGIAAGQVTASQPVVPGQAARAGATARQPGQRQQPARRPGSANRRPSGKKKRR